MKTQSILKLALLAVGFLVLALIGSAQAQVINAQMGYLGSGAPDMAGTSSSSTAAPLTYGGSTWNVYSAVSDISAVATGTNLLDSNGNPTGIGFIDTSATAGQNGGAHALPILTTYDYQGGAKGTFTLTGLNSADVYNFIYMAPSNGYFGETISNNNGAQTDTEAVNSTLASSTSWMDGENYLELTNLAPVFNATNSDYEISISITSGVNGYNNISGFQLQASLAETPEPSTAALMGLGGFFGLVFLISRRRLALK